MTLYSDEQLQKLPEFEDLEQALKTPDEVVRIRVYRNEKPGLLSRIFDFSNLQSLSICLTDVTQLLPRLSEFSRLQNLDLQACDIATFPEGILDLRHLRSLSIGNNSLKHLPEELTTLKMLEELSLSQNKFQQIPNTIGQLTRLKRLGLSYNLLEAIPESIFDLTLLEWLFLDVNRLREMPQGIGRLSFLKSLNLNHNKLRTLPDSICELRNLEFLSIEHNPFEVLPSCLSNLTGIKRFSIEAEKRSMFMDWSYKHSEKPVKVEEFDLKLRVNSTSELYAPLIAEIEKHHLTDAHASILDVAREAIEIETTVPDDYSQLGSSRLGGFPDLAGSELYPRTDGLYWSFLAQLNLSDISPYNNFLPRSGLLSFFLDSTESFNGRVLYYDGDLNALKPVCHGGNDEMFDPQDDYTQKPYKVRFRKYFSLPHELSEVGLDEGVRDAYSDCEALHESVDHHLNGYTFTQHESPCEQAANKFGGQADEWIPLLQLGWDSNVGFCFWDAGTLSFVMHREDLRRWDFSRIHVSLESS